MSDLRTRIKLARTEAGYRTQKEFAPHLGVTRETLAKYESKEDSITLDVLRNVSKLTGKPIAWFFLELDERIETGEKTITPKEALAVLAELVEASAAAPTSLGADPAPVESQRERTKSGVFAKKRQVKTSQSGRKAGNQ